MDEIRNKCLYATRVLKKSSINFQNVIDEYGERKIREAIGNDVKIKLKNEPKTLKAKIKKILS